MENRQAVQHRLGIARKALKHIMEYRPLDIYESDRDSMHSMKFLAEEALDDMNRQVDKKAREREKARDRWVARLAQEVKEEVDP